tara:strand:- start:4338 stop:4547 length:210 start_codon:yes stop_codon:yes gene_type:complete
MIIQTSAYSLVHFTKAFIVPKQKLPKIIHKTATRGESGISDSVTKEERSGLLVLEEISANPLPNPRFGI